MAKGFKKKHRKRSINELLLRKPKRTNMYKVKKWLSYNKALVGGGLGAGIVGGLAYLGGGTQQRRYQTGFRFNRIGLALNQGVLYPLRKLIYPPTEMEKAYTENLLGAEGLYYAYAETTEKLATVSPLVKEAIKAEESKVIARPLEDIEYVTGRAYVPDPYSGLPYYYPRIPYRVPYYYSRVVQRWNPVWSPSVNQPILIPYYGVTKLKY